MYSGIRFEDEDDIGFISLLCFIHRKGSGGKMALLFWCLKKTKFLAY
jgi:hypothetical protein